MYRAAYTYNSTDVKSLSFREGDQFTLLEKIDKHWWHVMNHLGEMGYVPASYIEKEESSNDEVLRSIDRAIEFIHLASTDKGGLLTPDQRESLQKLLQHRQSITQENSVSSGGQPKRKAPDLPRQTSTELRKAPQPPKHQSSPTSPEQIGGLSRSARSSTKTRAAPKPPQRNESIKQKPQDQTDSSQPSAVSTPKSSSSADRQTPKQRQLTPDLVIPKGLLGELVEQVRIETNLSYDMSKQAVRTVLEGVGSAVPEVANVMGAILSSLRVDMNMTSSNIIIEGSRDHDRLEVIFTELTACKDDAQQRSWALHEDEAVITGHLQELITILSDADPRVSKAVVTKDHFEYIQNLVLYYQMEHRSSLRLLLLKVFGALCNLDCGALSSLVCSVLPVELARDMQTDQENIPKLCYSALVSAMLLSTGEQIPFTHYDQLNADFVNYLLDSIDNPPAGDELDQVPDLFVNLILAFNLHLRDPSDNIVMKVLAEKRSAKSFSERIMLLVNRGVDPVKVFDHCSDTQDALLKFMADMFSSPTTSDLFYSNDMKVLIDIIVRQITDLNPGDQVRTENLSLILSIFINTSYWEDCHRLQELERSFVAIAIEEGKESEQDQLIVKEIQNKFGSKFTRKF